MPEFRDSEFDTFATLIVYSAPGFGMSVPESVEKLTRKASLGEDPAWASARRLNTPADLES
jgi:hypothetical protein